MAQIQGYGQICPVCKSALEAFESDGVTVDRCPFCRGIWFDPGELEAFCSSGDPSQPNSPFSGAKFEPAQGRIRRICPSCETESLCFGNLAGYEVWRCEDCRGFFVFSETIDQFIPLSTAGKVSVGLASLFELLAIFGR